MKRQHVFILILIALLKAFMGFSGQSSEVNEISLDTQPIHASIKAANPKRLRLTGETYYEEDAYKHTATSYF